MGIYLRPTDAIKILSSKSAHAGRNPKIVLTHPHPLPPSLFFLRLSVSSRLPNLSPSLCFTSSSPTARLHLLVTFPSFHRRVPLFLPLQALSPRLYPELIKLLLGLGSRCDMQLMDTLCTFLHWSSPHCTF